MLQKKCSCVYIYERSIALNSFSHKLNSFCLAMMRALLEMSKFSNFFYIGTVKREDRAYK